MAAKKICLERLAHKFPTVSWRTIWSRATHGKWQILRSWLERFNKVFICPQLITCSYLQYWSLYRTHSIIFLTSEHFAVWATRAPSSLWGLMLLRSFIAFVCSRIGIVCIRQWLNRLKIYVIFWGFSLWLSFFLFINPGHLNLLAHCCEISLRFQLARLVQHLSGLFSSRIYHVFVLSGIKLQQSTISFRNQSE